MHSGPHTERLNVFVCVVAAADMTQGACPGHDETLINQRVQGWPQEHWCVALVYVCECYNEFLWISADIWSFCAGLLVPKLPSGFSRQAQLTEFSNAKNTHVAAPSIFVVIYVCSVFYLFMCPQFIF